MKWLNSLIKNDWHELENIYLILEWSLLYIRPVEIVCVTYVNRNLKVHLSDIVSIINSLKNTCGRCFHCPKVGDIRYILCLNISEHNLSRFPSVSRKVFIMKSVISFFFFPVKRSYWHRNQPYVELWHRWILQE